MYCKKCDELMINKMDIERYEVNGELFILEKHYFVCSNCGQKILYKKVRKLDDYYVEKKNELKNIKSFM